MNLKCDYAHFNYGNFHNFNFIRATGHNLFIHTSGSIPHVSLNIQEALEFSLLGGKPEFKGHVSIHHEASGRNIQFHAVIRLKDLLQSFI